MTADKPIKANKHVKKQLPKEMEKYKFPKGKSANPKGRPKKEKCIPDILNRLTDEVVEIDGVKITKRDLILAGVVAKAIDGDQWSIQFIADRTEGKPFITQNINLNDSESPFELWKSKIDDTK